MIERRLIRAAASSVIIGLTTLFIVSILVHENKGTKQSLSLQYLRRKLSVSVGGSGVAESDAQLQDQSTFDPKSYAYFIIHYHRTGNSLSRSLRELLVAATDGAPMSNKRNNAFQYRMHEEITGCPYAMELSPNMIHVQLSPNLFCDTNVLAEYLLRNNNVFQEKKGVKIIHLIRNPFDMAFSNWIYHAQDPTPEKWVKKVNPCDEGPSESWNDQSLADMVWPALTMGDNPIMQSPDFVTLHSICLYLYKTSDKSKKWSFYKHLRNLDPQNALELATTHMMVQGRTGGDILRMANNIIRLKQVQQLEDQIRLSQHIASTDGQRGKMIQVMTVSMDEFIQQPKEAVLRFLDFALEDSSPPDVKERISRLYNVRIKTGDEHISNDEEILDGYDKNIVNEKGELEKQHLRDHELFGRVMGNIERLVDDALRESSSSV